MDHIEMIGIEFGPRALPEELGAGDHTLADFFSQNKKFLLEIVHKIFQLKYTLNCHS